MAKLMSDEFSPSKYATDLDFWQIPKGLARCTSISWGAKVLYAVIYGNAYKYDEARPSYKALQKHLGNPSKATMQRWIAELVNARLIRTIQRGRGISNVYRIMRSPLLGNMSEEEYRDERKYVYAGTFTEEPTLVDELTAIQYYYCELRDWVNKSVRPDDYPMPKLYVKAGTYEKQACIDAQREVIDRYLFNYDFAHTITFEVETDEVTATEWLLPNDKD